MASSKLKLISHNLCPYVQRARIVLEEKSIPHEIEFIDLANKPGWFLDISPLGKVPVLLIDGDPLFESSVIAEFLDEISPGSLHPSDVLHKAKNRAWIEFASSTLETIGAFYSAPDRLSFDAAVETLTQRFDALEAALGDGPYFNGHKFSLVDAAFAPLFRYFDVVEHFVDLGFFERTPKVADWRNALRRRPSVRKAAVSDYAKRLERFFISRHSVLADIVAAPQVA